VFSLFSGEAHGARGNCCARDVSSADPQYIRGKAEDMSGSGVVRVIAQLTGWEIFLTS